eukprot:1186324-Prorocentrum_minimum.AAC.2
MALQTPRKTHSPKQQAIIGENSPVRTMVRTSMSHRWGVFEFYMYCPLQLIFKINFPFYVPVRQQAHQNSSGVQ